MHPIQNAGTEPAYPGKARLWREERHACALVKERQCRAQHAFFQSFPFPPLLLAPVREDEPGERGGIRG